MAEENVPEQPVEMLHATKTSKRLGEGFIFSICLLAGFVAIAFFGMYMIAIGVADVKIILEYFVGLGALAQLFGVQVAIKAWLETRGQTSGA